MPEHGHLKRLERIWIPHAVYFITVCTHARKSVLATSAIHEVLRREWASARQGHGWLVGRYVVMPDHAHFFCAESHELINLVKLAMDAGLPYTVLRDGIYTHPTMTEALGDLLAGIK